MKHDPNAPITTELVYQHVGQMRAELGALRESVDALTSACRDTLRALELEREENSRIRARVERLERHMGNGA